MQHSRKTDLSNASKIFEQEFVPLLDAVYAFAYRLTGDETEAKDLVQATYLNAWLFIERYTEDADAKAWLFQICHQAFIKEWHSRKLRRYKLNYEDFETNQGIDDPVIQRFTQLRIENDKDQMGDETTRAINALPAGWQLVVLLDLEGFSDEEIAALLELPIGVVRSRLYRAHQTMAKQLSQYGKSEGYSISKIDPVAQESDSIAKAYAQLAHDSKIQSSDIPLNTPLPIDEILDDDFKLIQYTRNGIPSEQFRTIFDSCPFSSAEWSQFLNINTEKLQQFLVTKETVPPIFAERILKVFRILRQGESIFGTKNDFYIWLKRDIPAIGNIDPISLLDNAFGFDIIQNELTRIEHGVLA